MLLYSRSLFLLMRPAANIPTGRATERGSEVRVRARKAGSRDTGRCRLMSVNTSISTFCPLTPAASEKRNISRMNRFPVNAPFRLTADSTGAGGNGRQWALGYDGEEMFKISTFRVESM